MHNLSQAFKAKYPPVSFSGFYQNPLGMLLRLPQILVGTSIDDIEYEGIDILGY